VLTALLSAGWLVKALVRNKAKLTQTGELTAIQGDLDDEEALAALVEGVELVIHCAGLTRAVSERDFFQVNVGGTARLAAAAASAAGSPRLVLMSSLAAREPRLSAYAASKRGAETELERLGSSIRWTALRPPAVYGPGDRDILLYFKQFRSGFAFLPGQATQRLSLIHASDLADAVVAAADINTGEEKLVEVHDGHEGGYGWVEIVTVASGVFDRPIRRIPVPQPVMQMLATGMQAGGRLLGKAPILNPGKVRELYHPDWVCHGNRLCELSDWRPRMGLEQGLEETLRWYREFGML